MSEQKSLWESVRVEVIVTPMNTSPCECGDSTNDNSGSAPELHYVSLAPEYAKLVADALHGTMPTPPHLNEIKSDEFKRAMATMAAAVAAGTGVVVFGEEVEAVPVTAVSFAKDGGNDWYVSGENPIDGMTFDFNTLYKVEWDGVEYDSFATTIIMHDPDANSDYGAFCVGNTSIIGYDNERKSNEPFLIVKRYKRTETNDVYILTSSTAAAHTVKVNSVAFQSNLADRMYSEGTSFGRFAVSFGSGMGSLIANAAKSASGNYSAALNVGSVASGYASFAAGGDCVASGDWASAFGTTTKAQGTSSVALGNKTIASGKYSLALGGKVGGVSTEASGDASVAIGYGSVASAALSFVAGQKANANASMSAAFGNGTISTGRAAFTVGQYNVEDTNAIDTSHGSGARKYILTVGNGTGEDARSNAMTVDWDGNEELAGGLTLGKGTADETTITAAQLKALLALL